MKEQLLASSLIFLFGIAIGFAIGTFSQDGDTKKAIKKSLLKTYKYRLDDDFVINGSVDVEREEK